MARAMLPGLTILLWWQIEFRMISGRFFRYKFQKFYCCLNLLILFTFNKLADLYLFIKHINYHRQNKLTNTDIFNKIIIIFDLINVNVSSIKINLR